MVPRAKGDLDSLTELREQRDAILAARDAEMSLTGAAETYEMQRLAIRAKRLSTIGLTADSHPSGSFRATAAGGWICRDCLSAS